MAFPFLGLFIVFILVLAYQIKKGDSTQKQVEELFWDREYEANQVRRQDISGLPYITIPFEKFPIGISEEDDLIDYEKDLKRFEHLKILNLGNQSNTDLKLKYGPANLTALSEYDQNFIRLARTLVNYAICLNKYGFEQEAQTVLEFGVTCGSDISSNYTLLAQLYKKANNDSALTALRDKADSLDSLMKQSILEKLDHIITSPLA